MAMYKMNKKNKSTKKSANPKASAAKARADMGQKKVPMSNVPTRGRIKKLNNRTRKAGY